jgi:hypothetical protein
MNRAVRCINPMGHRIFLISNPHEPGSKEEFRARSGDFSVAEKGLSRQDQPKVPGAPRIEIDLRK